MDTSRQSNSILRKAAILLAALMIFGVGSLLVMSVQDEKIISLLQIMMLSISGYFLFIL